MGLIQFATDQLIFISASSKNAINLNHSLEVFERESGQKINKHKSEIMSSVQTPNSLKREVCDEMNIRKDTTSFIYLGSCLRLGHGGVGDAEGLIQRSGKKFAGWNGSYLSPMGRKILIQSVISEWPAKLLDGSSGGSKEIP